MAGDTEGGLLRVAMVCPYDLSRPGGVQGQAMGLARALRRLGHEVLVIAPDDRPPGSSSGHVVAAGRAWRVPANGSVAPVSLSPFAARRAVATAREWGADVVHLHEPLAPVLGYGFVVSRRWPMVGTFHRSGSVGGYVAMRRVARWARARIDVCTAVSAVARETALALCGGTDDTYEILGNGVDVDRFSGPQQAEPSDVPAVLFLGRHEHRKGLGVLLEAFASVRSPGVLWIAGDGPETQRLRARFPDSGRVRWLGVLSDDDVRERLTRAKVLCAPSLGGESFGMVLLEAMAARCRVVASDIPGYREAAGDHAVLVPPGDAAALAGALDALLAGTGDVRALDAGLDAGLDHARARSMDRLAVRYVEVYREARRRRTQGGDAAGPRLA